MCALVRAIVVLTLLADSAIVSADPREDVSQTRLVFAESDEAEPLPPPSSPTESDGPLTLPGGDDDSLDPLPPLEEELWNHGGSYLYAPEGDRLGWPDDEANHHPHLRLPEDWVEPKPFTMFQEFLGSDPIHPRPGLKWPGCDGYQWEPRVVGYGSYQMFGFALETNDRRQDVVGHQLLVDLDAQMTGTERFHMQVRPLGRENSGGSFYQFNDPAHYDDNSTLLPDRFWFEGELASMFGGYLDPFAVRDYQIAVGRLPFALHNRLLMNDDVTGAVLSKNTILQSGLSNLNLQGFYFLDDVDAFPESTSDVVGLHATADVQLVFIEATYAYLAHDDFGNRDANYAAASATKFFGPLSLAGRALFKWGDDGGRGDGQLTVLESNYHQHLPECFHHRTGFDHAVYYANAFWASEGWNPISGGNFDRLRSTFELNPLVSIAQGRQPFDTQGAALGVQLFRNHDDESLTPEVAYEAPGGTPVGGVSLRYQRKTGPRSFIDISGIRTWSDDPAFDREGVFAAKTIVF